MRYHQKIDEQETKLKYYAVPIKYEEVVKEEIKRLLSLDIIEEVRTTYASPSFLLKKNKELRLVVDYRWVNNFVKD